MRTSIHIALILLVGVGLGFGIRGLRPPKPGPDPDEIVYTNSPPIDGSDVDPSQVENPDPSHPPDDQTWLSRFELIERSGQTVKSEDLLGQPYVVSFFFSTCPSICVQQNQKLKELQDAFAGRAVKFVAISVDPETDTPQQLREYATRFGADKDQWLFMTGDLTYIRRIGAEIFQQPVNKKFHTERFVLVDREGAIEGFYNWPEKKQFAKLQETIREMLDSGAS